MLVTAVFAALAAGAGTVASAPPAAAVLATGAGVGFRSPDGWWIGSWSLADGTRGFCLNLGDRAPSGHDLETSDAAALGRYTAEDRARLAYISRTWASTDDPVTAAAAQLAAWTITGLNGQTAEGVAGRAGAHAGEVLDTSRRMLAEIDGPKGASRSVTAHLSIGRDDHGGDVLVARLDADFLAGAKSVDADEFDGLATLDGAVFADGSHELRVRNGLGYPITPDEQDSVMRIAATVSFADLPFGDAATIAHGDPGVQNVLVASPARATGSTRVALERPSSLPFQPTVTTRANESVAAPGARVRDTLQVGVAAGEGLTSAWGVYGDDGGPYLPIPAVVRSRLLGPFPSAPVPADSQPADAPVACEVTTRIDHGPGEYVTPPCTLSDAGHYVWIETISPEDTPAAEGRARLRPWTSRFGEAPETVTVRSAARGVPAALAETGVDMRRGLPWAAVAAASTLLGVVAVAFARRTRRSGGSRIR